MKQLEVLNIALEAIERLRPVITRIRRHDKKLAQQIVDAANSAALNIGEGAQNDAGTRKSRFHTAAGSANEARVGLLAAARWGHISEQQALTAANYFDRVVAMLYRLIH